MATQTQVSGLQKLVDTLNGVLIGKEDAVNRVVTALIARGHILIEDVPGIGKTLLGLALSKSIEASFKRIQFTNDLLPSDILGVNLFDQKEGKFRFQPGPIFSHVILADEINRSTPKTQSALLEAMNERQVSIDGTTHEIQAPFLVIATENPVEYHGTFPLPEAQLDRFLMRVQIGYPDAKDEVAVLEGGELKDRLQGVKPCLSTKDVIDLQEQAERVTMEKDLLEYVVQVTRKTREHERVKLGVSPRGSQALARAVRSYALTQGRNYAVPDDVKRMAVPVLAHRIVLDSSQYGLTRVTESEAFISDILADTDAPN